MKFKLCYTHRYGKYEDVEINTLEELLKLVKKKMNDSTWIIVSYYGNKYRKDELKWKYVLEVYDDYRE